MTKAPLIHIIDDDEAIRQSLGRLLTEAGFEVKAYGSTGEFLLEPSHERPACLLLDVRLPGPSGLDLQAALRRQNVESPIIFLTGHADVPSSVQAMKAGAVDFLEKPVAPEVLIAAIRAAIERDISWREARLAEASILERVAQLSASEHEVFDLIIRGKLNKEIAYELAISERTVKTRRAQIMAKLGVRSVAELGAQAALTQRITEKAKSQ